MRRFSVVRTENILDYPVSLGSMPICVESIISSMEDNDRSPRWLACLNPHSYVMALKQPAFAAALKSADYLLPDGAGIVIASRLLGGQLRARVTGNDFFVGLLGKLNECSGHSVFFLGSTEETLKLIRNRMMIDFPKVNIVGTYSPPFKAKHTQEECDAMVSAINLARPDVLWVGMTAPKQELWIRQNLERLETVRIAAAIGAVYDFYSGNVKRTHPVFQKMGLEWLPRLLREPRRLWRRMFVSAPIFVWHVIRARFGYHRDPNRP